MASPTTIFVKFKKPIAIGLPTLGTLAPNLYATTRVVNGFASPVPVQDYDFDEEYEVKLLPETPDPLPPHLNDLDPEVKKQFATQQATALATNHTVNNLSREALKQYEREGIIEITHDTFEKGERPEQKPRDPGEWKLQDQNQLKRLEAESLDAINNREKRLSDPNPHVPRQAVGSNADFQATSERNAEFGDHEGVPTTEEPKPKEKTTEPRKKGAKNPTSTEDKAGTARTAVPSTNTLGGEADPSVPNPSDNA